MLATFPTTPTKREDGWSTPPRHEQTTSGAQSPARLRDTLTETTYDTWFGQAHPRSFNGEQLVVEVPNDFTRDWIEGHFIDLVTRAAVETAPSGVVVSFTLGERVQTRTSCDAGDSGVGRTALLHRRGRAVLRARESRPTGS